MPINACMVYSYLSVRCVSRSLPNYSEIQQIINSGARPVLDRVAAVQTLVYGGNNWVSYNNTTTTKMKIDYANRNYLGGTMVWAASTDDAKGSAAAALSGATGLKKFHSLIAIAPSDAKASCVWTNCGDKCPFGYTPAALSGGGLAMTDRRVLAENKDLSVALTTTYQHAVGKAKALGCSVTQAAVMDG